MKNLNKKLSLVIGNDGLTSAEVNKLATDINMGSVSLDVHGVLLQFDVNTFDPTIENGFISFPLYIDTELFPSTTEELVNSTSFYDVSGSVWIEDSPYDVEHISLVVVDNSSSHTASFPLKLV